MIYKKIAVNCLTETINVVIFTYRNVHGTMNLIFVMEEHMGFFKKISIRYQLLILALSTVIVIMFIFFVYFFQNSLIITKKNLEYTDETVKQLVQHVSDYCDSIKSIITGLAYTTTIQDFLLETDPLKKYEMDKKIGSLLNNITILRDGIVDIVLLGNNGSFSSLKGSVSYVDSVKELFKDKDNAYFSEVIEVMVASYEYHCFFVGLEIYSIDRNRKVGEKIGYFCILIDSQAISPTTMKKNRLNDMKVYLLDRSNHIFSTNDHLYTGDNKNIVNSVMDYKEGFYEEKADGVINYIQVGILPDLKGKVVSIITKDLLTSELVEVRSIILIIFIGAIMALSMPFTIIINNILNPLKKFMIFMDKVKSGDLKNLKKRIMLEGYEEIMVMANEFNNMLDEVHRLTTRLFETTTSLYQSELEKHQSELAFLRSQINPHFLYNTLETIKGIATVRGVNEIKEMTNALGRIFKYSIIGEDEVLFMTEVEIARAYIKIQKIRFCDRFAVEYDFSQEALKCKVPKMILQPIIENSIYHGLELKLEKGNLYISGKINQKKELVICIRDDGIGMNKETFNAILHQLESKYPAKKFDAKGRIGILNVNNRLKLIYGSQYGIEIKSICHEGTEVIITLPASGL